MTNKRRIIAGLASAMLAGALAVAVLPSTARAIDPAPALIGTATQQSIPSGDTLNDIACATATQCYAVGTSGIGVVIPIIDGHVGAAVAVPNTANLSGIACPTSTLCEVVGAVGLPNNATIGVEVDLFSGTPQPASHVAGTTNLVGIACSNVDDCYALDNVEGDGNYSKAAIVPIIDASPKTPVNVFTDGYLASLSCGSATSCVAAGYEEEAGCLLSCGPPVPVIVPITSGAVGAVVRDNNESAGGNNDIACPSATSCAVVSSFDGGWFADNTGGGLFTIDNGAFGSADPQGNTIAMSSIACPYSSTCIGVGSEGPVGYGSGGSEGYEYKAAPIVNGVMGPEVDLGLGYRSQYQRHDLHMTCPSPALCIAVGDLVLLLPISVATTTTVTSSPNPAAGSPVTLTATVDGPVGAAEPTGTVTFKDITTGQTLTTAALSGGTASYTIPALEAGGLTVEVDYSGSSIYDASTGTLSITVNKNHSSVAVASSADPSLHTTSVTFTATVTVPAGDVVPTGTVSFTDTTASAALGSASLSSSGQASVSTSNLAVGTHTIQAAYSGDADTAPSVSSLSQIVSLVQTTTTVTALNNPSSSAQGAIFRATVTSRDTADDIKGAVTFTDQHTGIVLGSIELNSSGAAVVSSTALAVGQHTIVAAYSGDPLHHTSHGNVLQTVNAAATPGLAHLPSSTQLNGVGCGSSTSCIAVGVGPGRAGGRVGKLMTLDTSTGQFGIPSVVTNTVDLTGIACATASSCIAVGEGGTAGNQGVLVPVNNGVPGALQLVDGTSLLTAITCTADSSCLAVGVNSAGTAAVSVPVGLAGAGAVTVVAGSAVLNGIACVSSTSCVAVGGDPAGNGIVVPIVNGSAGTPRAVNDYTTLNAVVCPASTTCMAVGQDDRDQVGVLLPVGLSSVGTAVVDSNANSLTGIACASTTSCVAVGQGGAVPAGLVVPVQNGAFGIDLLVPGTFAFTGIGCDTSTTCTAVGQDIGEGVAVPVTIGGGGGGTLIQTLKKSSTTVGSSLNPATYGTPVTFTATVTPPANGVTPTGAVTFTDTTTGATLGAATLDGSGKAALSVSTLAVGTHTVNAAYSGDANNNASSGTITETVNKAPTKLAALAAKTSTHSFTAVLSRSDSGGAISGQTITFTTRNAFTKKQDVVCSAVTNSDGLATCSHAVPAGDLFDTSYTATYAGTGNYLNSVTTAKLSL